ncbi:hypothetical protein [Nocardia sp. NPDC056000]|uniref:hypothetical protein n=1 Tax=Nocardia sp. NPDC056000 TaxID=3345674 RepID=UPI0035DDA623
MQSAESRLAASALIAVELLRRAVEHEAACDSRELFDGKGNGVHPRLMRLSGVMNDLRVHFDLNPQDIDLNFHADVLPNPPVEPPEPAPPIPPLEPAPSPLPPVPEPAEPFTTPPPGSPPAEPGPQPSPQISIPLN